MMKIMRKSGVRFYECWFYGFIKIKCFCNCFRGWYIIFIWKKLSNLIFFINFIVYIKVKVWIDFCILIVVEFMF